ncbi:hypothetical protein PR048_021923 [Dryococelus australis]|uniref:Uncharacterized protein n=1 Tax=Dryococelus australis TaxID=614101 RepID=A0ABQ9GZK1_9NEOP|nr:hypothetical protein PR048_021923 [Dryococelus australis]
MYTCQHELKQLLQIPAHTEVSTLQSELVNTVPHLQSVQHLIPSAVEHEEVKLCLGGVLRRPAALTIEQREGGRAPNCAISFGARVAVAWPIDLWQKRVNPESNPNQDFRESANKNTLWRSKTCSPVMPDWAESTRRPKVAVAKINFLNALEKYAMDTCPSTGVHAIHYAHCARCFHYT